MEMELYINYENEDIKVMVVRRIGGLYIASDYIEEHEIPKGMSSDELVEFIEEKILNNHPTDIIYYENEDKLNNEISMIIKTLNFKQIK